jgi:UPF0755 protein
VTNEPSWDDIFSSQPGAAPAQRPQEGGGAPLTRRELREAEERAASAKTGKKRSLYSSSYGEQPPSKKKRRLGWLWALLVVVALGAGGAFAVWTLYEDKVRQVLGWELPNDFEGTGNGVEVQVVIKPGDFGLDIARTLSAAGVTKTTDAFYKLLLPMQPQPNFIPGTYRLQQEMSAEAALAALLDPANRITSQVVIPEGTKITKVFELLAASTSIEVAEFDEAAQDLASFGVPAEAPSLEGYLFPATYTFDPGLSAHDILAQMVSRAFQSLDKAGVAVEDRHRVLTMAALIQKEGGSTDDFYKVSRVFTNRIDIGMLLQSDATVSYGAGGTSIHTTAAERADASNPYNTYVHPGLPVGPIGAPGDAAIDAALHPVDGPWLYFVLIDGYTGETAFSETLSEHNAAVKKWQAWYRDHPDFDN